MNLFLLCSVIFPVLSLTRALVLDVNSAQSVRDAAALTAHGVQELYNGNQTGGVLGKWPFPPYYWWESGGAWGGMIHYWRVTGDESYVDVTHEALMSQLGPRHDFIRVEEMSDTGNDDQAFWAFAAMSAAEYGFPAPSAPAPAWLDITVTVWNQFESRWNYTHCNGGLKWQFYPQNAGYNYKSTISNAAFFQLSARLARLTGNQTYLDWSVKIWDWMRGVGLMDDIYNVFDGTDENINCTGVDHHQWTYNVGAMLYGSAVLQNLTGSDTVWAVRTAGLLSATDSFVTPFMNASDVLFEAACELGSACNTDQWSMKAFLARWLGGTAVMAPFTADRIRTILRASANGAAAACTGGHYGNSCGSKWYSGEFDGITGLGQQLSAMDVFSALLVNDSAVPATLPQVHLHSTATYWPTTIMNPSVAASTARPLHDLPATSVPS